MIRIRVLEDPSGKRVGLRAQGHSGSAPAGEDLVCAAVTTVFEMLSEGTRDLSPEALQVHRDPDETHWEMQFFPGKLDRDERRLIRRLLAAGHRVLENVAQGHPDHCSIRRESIR